MASRSDWSEDSDVAKATVDTAVGPARILDKSKPAHVGHPVKSPTVAPSPAKLL